MGVTSGFESDGRFRAELSITWTIMVILFELIRRQGENIAKKDAYL